MTRAAHIRGQRIFGCYLLVRWRHVSRSRTIAFAVAALVLLAGIVTLLVQSRQLADHAVATPTPADAAPVAPRVVVRRRPIADAAVAVAARFDAGRAWRPDDVPAGVDWDQLMGTVRPMFVATVRSCFEGRPDDDHVRVDFRLQVRGGWATVADLRAIDGDPADPLTACVVDHLSGMRLPGGQVDFDTRVEDDFIAWEVRERGR